MLTYPFNKRPQKKADVSHRRVILASFRAGSG
jgi:hypothetical protein